MAAQFVATAFAQPTCNSAIRSPYQDRQPIAASQRRWRDFRMAPTNANATMRRCRKFGRLVTERNRTQPEWKPS